MAYVMRVWNLSADECWAMDAEWFRWHETEGERREGIEEARLGRVFANVMGNHKAFNAYTKQLETLMYGDE